MNEHKWPHVLAARLFVFCRILASIEINLSDLVYITQSIFQARLLLRLMTQDKITTPILSRHPALLVFGINTHCFIQACICERIKACVSKYIELTCAESWKRGIKCLNKLRRSGSVIPRNIDSSSSVHAAVLCMTVCIIQLNKHLDMPLPALTHNCLLSNSFCGRSFEYFSLRSSEYFLTALFKWSPSATIES